MNNNIPHEKIIKIESRTFSKLWPDALFEWYMNSCKLYLIKPLADGWLTRDGALLAEMVRTPLEAKQAVAAFVQGFD